MPEQVPEQISDLYPLWGKGQEDLYGVQIEDLFGKGTNQALLASICMAAALRWPCVTFGVRKAVKCMAIPSAPKGGK